MSLALTTHIGQSVVQKISPQLRAVLTILCGDRHLMEATMPHVDLNADSIQWEGIYHLALSPTQKAAVDIAFGIWTDEQKPDTNFFGPVLNMATDLQTAVLRALAIRWGIKVKGI